MRDDKCKLKIYYNMLQEQRENLSWDDDASKSFDSSCWSFVLNNMNNLVILDEKIDNEIDRIKKYITYEE